jgi:cell division protein FtsL
MSVPARRIDPAPAQPVRVPATHPHPAPPARTTAARPRTSSPPRKRRRARRGLHPTFMVFASTLIVLLIVGVVALNALFAQTAFAVHSMQSNLTDLSAEHDVLATDEARLSSPARVAAWAERYQMVLPHSVVILRVPHFGRLASVRR